MPTEQHSEPTPSERPQPRTPASLRPIFSQGAPTPPLSPGLGCTPAQIQLLLRLGSASTGHFPGQVFSFRFDFHCPPFLCPELTRAVSFWHTICQVPQVSPRTGHPLSIPCDANKVHLRGLGSVCEEGISFFPFLGFVFFSRGDFTHPNTLPFLVPHLPPLGRPNTRQGLGSFFKDIF